MMLQTLYNLRLYVVLTSMFSYKFWEFFRATFPLKALCDYLTNEVYLFCKNASPKYVTNFAKNMWIM